MIRRACVFDVPALVELGIAYSKEALYHELFPVDLDYSVQVAMQSVQDENCCVLVAVKDHKVVGFLYAAITLFPWSRVPLAVDQLLYIAPEARGSVLGAGLIRAYEAWAKDKGLLVVRMSLASGITEERTRKLYDRLGYKQVGFTYSKEVQ